MKKVRPKHGGKRPGSGRKPTGRDPVRQLRMTDSQYDAVAKWAAKQVDKPTWSEAVRRLLNKALGIGG